MKIRKSNEDKIFLIFNHILAAVILVIAFYPLYFVLIASFSSADAVVRGKVMFFPKNFTLVGYELMLAKKEIWVAYLNTIIYTLAGTTINLIFTVSAAYALSRKTLPFRSAFNVYFLVTMFVSGGLIPTYMLVYKLGMVDTFTIVVLLGAVNVWNMIICRSFFETSISPELIEAAKIDGCSELGIYFRVVLPLSKAILAVMVLYFAVGHWNGYFNALIYLRDSSRYPLQLVLRSLLLQTKFELGEKDIAASRQMMDIQSMKYGVIVVTSLPVLVLYPFIQKYFVKGVMIGAVKG